MQDAPEQRRNGALVPESAVRDEERKITAIAFDCILTGKSVLILSDKNVKAVLINIFAPECAVGGIIFAVMANNARRKIRNL